MFDAFTPSLPDPRPEPHGLRTRAMLPLLRVQATEAAVAFLAHATAYNALQAAQAAALTWGPEAGAFGPASVQQRDALDPTTSYGKVMEARAHLGAACDRHRSTTGEDGLALARGIIVGHYGAALADLVLAPLAASAPATGAWQSRIDALLACEPAEATCPVEPTPAERAAALAEILAAAFSGAGMAAVPGLLAALGQASSAGSGNDTSSALHALTDALQAAERQGVGVEEMQEALGLWADATGGPRVLVNAIP